MPSLYQLYFYWKKTIEKFTPFKRNKFKYYSENKTTKTINVYLNLNKIKPYSINNSKKKNKLDVNSYCDEIARSQKTAEKSMMEKNSKKTEFFFETQCVKLSGRVRVCIELLYKRQRSFGDDARVFGEIGETINGMRFRGVLRPERVAVLLVCDQCQHEHVARAIAERYFLTAFVVVRETRGHVW